MKTSPSPLRSFRFPWYTAPILIVLVGLLTYGLLIREMGFYWDDWVFIWMAKTTGPAGLARYFSTNRPFWGWIIAQTTALLGSSPWQWQIFGTVLAGGGGDIALGVGAACLGRASTAPRCG